MTTKNAESGLPEPADRARTLFFNGDRVSTTQSALDELDLHEMQTISETTLHEVIAANARAFCAKMEQRRAQGLPEPDVTELKTKTARQEPLN